MKTRVLPSIPAAAAAGAVGVPLLIVGWRFLERTSGSQLLLIVWGVVAFFVPLFFAVHDRQEAARWRSERGFLGLFIAPASREAFRRFYIPAWKRMAVWFISAVASTLLLKAAGVDL